jgi:hypothetical protein
MTFKSHIVGGRNVDVTMCADRLEWAQKKGVSAGEIVPGPGKY